MRYVLMSMLGEKYFYATIGWENGTYNFVEEGITGKVTREEGKEEGEIPTIEVLEKRLGIKIPTGLARALEEDKCQDTLS